MQTIIGLVLVKVELTYTFNMRVISLRSRAHANLLEEEK